MHFLLALIKVFTWDAVIENADHTPCTDLDTYELGIGATPGNYAQFFKTGNVVTYSQDLPSGTSYVAVRAIDTSKNASEWSNELKIDIVGQSPAPSESPTPESSPVPTTSPRPSPTQYTDIKACTAAIRARENEYRAQLNLTNDYRRKYEECRKGQ